MIDTAGHGALGPRDGSPLVSSQHWDGLFFILAGVWLTLVQLAVIFDVRGARDFMLDLLDRQASFVIWREDPNRLYNQHERRQQMIAFYSRFSWFSLPMTIGAIAFGITLFFVS